MNTIEVLTLVIAIAAIIGIIIQHMLLQQTKVSFSKQLDSARENLISTLSSNHLQTRREVALDLWDKWETLHDIKDRKMLLNYLKWLETENDIEVKRQWIKFIIQGSRVSSRSYNTAQMPKKMIEIFSRNDDSKFTTDELEEIRMALITTINIMEKVAVAYLFHVADREILDTAFKDVIFRTTTDLEPLIGEMRKENGLSNLWICLTDLVFEGDWRKNNTPVKGQKSADMTFLAHKELENNILL